MEILKFEGNTRRNCEEQKYLKSMQIYELVMFMNFASSPTIKIGIVTYI